MSTIYLFDVDGTLTPAKERIDRVFGSAFLKWMKDKEVYIVSGGSFVRILDQLGTDIVDRCAGVFACMGNIFYQQLDQINPSGFDEWQIIYENSFRAPRGLKEKLKKIVEDSGYHTKTGKHSQRREGMINFSIVGSNATTKQRKEYAEYDLENKEREAIVDALKKQYASLDFAIGGAVSIDIFKIGADKSQIIDRHFDEAIEGNRILFVGDRIPFPGNDCSLAVALRQHPNGCAYEVERWQDTAEILKTEPFA
jgi:phosphomannomutase